MKIRRTLTLAIGLAALAVTTAFAQTAAAQSSKTTGPTLIKDTENPARSAVQGSCMVQWTNIGGNSECDLMTVPANKRLVLEHTSGICRAQGTDVIRNAQIQTTLAGAGLWTYLVMTNQATTVDGHYSVTSQPMRAYSDPGSTVKAVAWFEGNPIDSAQYCIATVSGHLVDVQ
jgi:hypothetical protein